MLEGGWRRSEKGRMMMMMRRECMLKEKARGGDQRASWVGKGQA